MLGIVRKQIPELDWQLVHRPEDPPEGAPAVMAGQVIRGGWQSDGDDPQLRQVRWYRREEDRLVFTPPRRSETNGMAPVVAHSTFAPL